MARTLLLLAACLAAAQCIKNIDLQQPIVRLAPDELNDEGYFGYSLVLHQKVDSTGFSASLDNTYLIVGAPNGTHSNSEVRNTGFVYECRITGNGKCTRITHLSDDSANTQLENKEGQFMGGALASNGDRFMACAHRYVNYNPSNRNTRSVYGRCYYADRSLDDFTEFQPCSGVGRRTTQSLGVCQAGMSAVVAETSDGIDHLVVGAPGSYLWRGIVIRSTPGQFGSTRLQPYDPPVTTPLVGRDTASPRATSVPLLLKVIMHDLATSVPRLNSYFGAVHIIRNDNTLQMISQNLGGDQMGEYYGFSLAALNLAGTDLDELIVSAPMYRDRNIGPETGRVYVYRNIGGTLSLVTRIVGVTAYSRFGHAMVALGDISGDGFDDVAISAPFGEGRGTVYIYHSSASQLLTPTPQQVITPSTLNLFSNVMSRFLSFGTSLASFDVDGNGFNDLAIGSYKDQTAVVLRTRPLARITTTLVATPGIVDIMSGQTASYDGAEFPYFEVRYTVFNGQGAITLDIALVSERARREQGLQQRLFFEDTSDNSRRDPVITRQGVMLESGESDELTIRVFVMNDTLDFFTGFTLDLEITTRDFVRPENDGDENPTNLDAFPVVSISGPSSLQNNGNNAFLAQLVFNVPIQLLQFSGVSEDFITCNQGDGNGQFTPYICDIGNPFGMDVTRGTEFRFIPADSLTGEEGNIGISFNATSLNEAGELADNTVVITLQVNTVADIFVDEGIAFPDQVNHASERPSGVIDNVTALGPEFTTTFTIGNNGPSIIPDARLIIYWPLNVKDSQNYFLYPTGWRTIQSTSVSVSCENTHFNPAGFEIATSEDNEGTPGGIPGSSDGRRRRRSVGGMKPRRRRGRNTRMPRQDMEIVPISAERTVLRSGNRVQVEISAVIDERHLGAEFRSIPGMVVIRTESPRQGDESVPWYAIAVPIAVGVILLIVAVVVLYFCGFFRRKNKQEIEDQARENLAEENTAM
ncbi:Integrin alpha-V [Geodia barretti]|uniref:Integrin alpha-V n=1 Tax=Geodia barretti TaxID=519541 RepID=A0AA35W687_GEOBA|nr:Integrin alpha-V [Geodia barretti]